MSTCVFISQGLEKVTALEVEGNVSIVLAGTVVLPFLPHQVCHWLQTTVCAVEMNWACSWAAFSLERLFRGHFQLLLPNSCSNISLTASHWMSITAVYSVCAHFTPKFKCFLFYCNLEVIFSMTTVLYTVYVDMFGTKIPLEDPDWKVSLQLFVESSSITTNFCNSLKPLTVWLKLWFQVVDCYVALVLQIPCR